MKVFNRSPMYLVFVGIQHLLLLCAITGIFVKPIKRDPTICADEAGLLIVQTSTLADIGTKGLILAVMFWKNKLSFAPEMIGKPIGGFITALIFCILSIVFVITGSITLKKSAYFLFLQGCGYANESAFHLYHRFTYRPISA